MRPPELSLRQLQYVVAVAEKGRFRRAAEACHVSQPALSAQLAQVEAVLGVRLFERDRRRVLLTAAGEVVVARAKEVLRAVDDLVAAAAQLTDPLAGTLRVGVIPTVAPYALPELTPALRRRFPRLTVYWREERTAELVAALAAGHLDAALVALEAPLGDVEHEVIAHDAFVLVAAAGHPLARRAAPACPDELDGETVYLLEDGHCLRTQALALCSRTDAQEAGYRATSLATLIQLVAGGGGVTLLPELALGVENRHGELVVRRFRDPAPSRTIALCWRKRSPLAAALRAVAATLREAWPAPRDAPARAPRSRPRAQAR